MINKYKNLNDLLNTFKPLILRIKKEWNHYALRIQCFNSIELNDIIVDDILQLIIDKSGLTLKELITDVNETIKERNYWRVKKIKCVENKKELIQHIKNICSNYDILTNPIKQLLYWNCTTQGYDFYGRVNKNVNQTLKVFEDVISLLYE